MARGLRQIPIKELRHLMIKMTAPQPTRRLAQLYHHAMRPEQTEHLVAAKAINAASDFHGAFLRRGFMCLECDAELSV